jgi:Protein of unknown function (DUF2867)
MNRESRAKIQVMEIQIPDNSRLKASLDSVSYWDAFQAQLTTNEDDIDQLYFAIFSHIPLWLQTLLACRNWLVSMYGLKGPTLHDLNRIETGREFKIGEKMGVFTLVSKDENELILGADDKHLNFRVSVLRSVKDNRKGVVVSTVVEVNNVFGRIYLFIIAPFHRLAVKALIRNALVSGRL